MGTEVREGGDESALLGLEPGLLEAEGEKGGPQEDVERAGVRRGMAMSNEEAGAGGWIGLCRAEAILRGAQ